MNKLRRIISDIKLDLFFWLAKSLGFNEIEIQASKADTLVSIKFTDTYAERDHLLTKNNS